MAEQDAFTQMLKSARVAQAAQLDAMLDVHDVRVLRLEALRNCVLPQLANHPAARALFELNIQHGERPKLWLDLISAVEMEPNPKTYRLVQDKDSTRETLFETSDLDDMSNYVLRYLAHRLIAHDKQVGGLRTNDRPVEGPQIYGFWDLLYVWFTGLLFGILALVAWALSTGRLK